MTAGRPGKAAWLTSIEMLGTTTVVLMIGGMVLWYEAEVRDPRLGLTIGSGMLVYAAAVVAFGRRWGAHIAVWPFVLAGLCAGVVAELLNARFMLSRESAAAGLTGVVIGVAHWTALRTWLRLTRSTAGA
jgi:uncharacterized membrane protein (UPF0136 family)